MNAFAALSLLLGGCTDFVGFPWKTTLEDETGNLFDLMRTCDVVETEPNDLNGNTDFDSLGTLVASRDLTVCGAVSYGYLKDNDDYEGDMDVFLFTTWGVDRLTVEATWEEGIVVGGLCLADSETDEYVCDDIGSYSVVADRYYYLLLYAWEGLDLGYSIRLFAQ